MWKLNQAGIQFQKNNLNSAEKIYQNVLDKDANNINALTWLGSLYSETGKFVKAYELLEKAIRIDSTKYESYFNMGLLQAQMQRYEDAIKSWQNALARCSIPKQKKAQFYYNISRTYLDIHNYGKSMDYANKALKLQPNYKEAEENKLYAYNKIKNR